MSMTKVYQLMKLNRFVKSHRPKVAGVLLLNLLGARHLFVRFDPVIACNLSCQMCYFSDKDFRKNNKGMFKPDEVARLANMFFPKTIQVVFGCGAEPTLYPGYTDLVKIAKDHGVPQVGMVSNGQLMSESDIEALVSHGLNELILSLHGVRKDTYERMMTGASYETFHKVLGTFDRVKQAAGATDPALRINYTVNSDNLEELADFFEVFGQYNIHTLQVRPIMDIGQTGYRTFDLDRFQARYAEIIAELETTCQARGVTFLARKDNPGYKESTGQDYGSLALPAVFRFMSPQRVWRTDFDWRNEDYRAFCKRIGFRTSLVRALFSSPKEMARQNALAGSLTLSYEVL